MWIPSCAASFSMAKQIPIDTAPPADLPIISCLSSRATPGSLSEAKICECLPRSSPLLQSDLSMFFMCDVFSHTLCSLDHTVEIHIQIFLWCLDLLQHHFLCPLQITLPSVQNVLAKETCPAPSFLKSIASSVCPSADSFIRTSCLSSAPKLSSPSSSILLLQPALLPVSPLHLSGFQMTAMGFLQPSSTPLCSW